MRPRSSVGALSVLAGVPLRLGRLPRRLLRELRLERIGLRAFGRLRLELALGHLERVPRVLRDPREARVDVDEGVRQDAGRGDPCEGLVIGRDDIPRRPRRARVGQDLAERLLVVVPVRALLGVARAELPIPVRFVDPRQEASPLLFPRQVEEQLHEPIALVCQVVLPVVDLAEATPPDPAVLQLRRQLLAGEDLRMDADDEDLLVIGAIEDADVAALGQPLLVTPEVVVVQVLARGHLEAADLDALRVDAAHDVADRPVLPRGIHRLEDHDDAVGALGGQTHLVLGEDPDPGVKDLLRFLDADHARPGGIEAVRQTDLAAGFHAEWCDELGDPLRSDCRHGVSPPNAFV